MEKMECIIERITYNNPENGYSVLKCNVHGFDDRVCVIGYFPNASVGSVFQVEGYWKNDKKYGTQFYAQNSEQKMPATSYAIEKYLGGGMIKGIGKARAKAIVEEFGENTFDIIENSPENLLEINGVGKKILNKLTKGWEEQKEIRNLMMFLQQYKINPNFATKVFKQYGNNSISIIQSNPYRLADDIWGIGFKTADEIGNRLGFKKDSFVRLQAGILYTLNQSTNDGHCFLTKEQIYTKASEILDCEEHYIIMTLDEMIHTEKVLVEEDSVYIPSMLYAEEGVSSRLKKRNGNALAHCTDAFKMKRWLKNKTGIEYDDTQVEGIITAMQNPTSVLTGGPGTGKTTTVLGIITGFEAQNKKILLAAPTGRAAKRLAESTGKEAMTIHRMLGVKPPSSFEHNEENPLDGDVLIVDECSMIDLILMNNLLKAVPEHMVLVLVGDIDQLPSVGPGNVLRDIIASNAFPVIQLTKIFRQAAQSKIITNAHLINKGYMPDIHNSKGTDFFFMEEENTEMISQKIVQLVSKNLPNYTHMSSADIQILTPMQKGEIGTLHLNQQLQNVLNPSDVSISSARYSFHENDKVMQLKNNYDKNVFNGDIGFVRSLNLTDQELTVDFDGNYVTYEKEDLSELSLAYAMTIHKSQGSEYPVVVMPISMSNYIMLQRNLIYTGVTRAKKMIVIIGTQKAISYCVRNQVVRKRNTKLKERLSS